MWSAQFHAGQETVLSADQDVSGWPPQLAPYLDRTGQLLWKAGRILSATYL
ncbi:MAG: hypothetical protein CM15mP119_0660 [Alphaproteobacteria bacterium]|nr:MAG: hypothetical protein CM15mP119_0660 [Alphaproteobacteria bacterium]